MFAWLRELTLRLLSTLGLYSKNATVVLLGKSSVFSLQRTLKGSVDCSEIKSDTSQSAVGRATVQQMESSIVRYPCAAPMLTGGWVPERGT